jgi:SMC interacting uncharacterized protein involved in chromosome segregation
MLNASQFGFHCSSQHDITMCEGNGPRDPQFQQQISTAAVFLDIEEAFDSTWHTGLLYKPSKLEFSINLIKLVSSILSQRKFSVSFEGEISTPRVMQAGVPQGSVLSPTLYNT